MYEDVEFEVISALHVPSVFFQLFSKGLLQISQKIPLKKGKAKFTVLPKFSYTPKAHCIVFYIDDYGEVISDAITLHFEEILPNYVSLTLESSDVKPHGIFKLNVTSTLNSSVSLMAIDQRVLSIDRNYDITKEYVFDRELVKYDKFVDNGVYDEEIPFWFYFESYQKRFLDVGAVILTNANQEIPCRPIDPTEPYEISTEMEDTYTEPPPINVEAFDPLEDIKKMFINTFMFETVEIDEPLEEGSVQGYNLIDNWVPDIEASWLITGVAVSDEYGLGLTSSPTILNSFLKFYIDVIVPVSVKIGEVFVMEILVVNLFDESISADITFFKDDSDFNVLRPYAYNWTSKPDGQYQKIHVQNRSIERLRIEVQPKVIGFIGLKISAKSSKAGDTAVKYLLVFPEGFLTFENKAEILLLDECDYEKKKVTLSCSVPYEIPNDSINVIASVSGDVLGPALLGLQSLIRLPTGCAEEIMMYLVPDVLALDYLKLTKRLTASLGDTAVEYLASAYEKMLQFRHSDGSFSAFGNSDVNGSTWLTAYVVKYFRRVQRYIKVDEEVISDALEFILSKQEYDGKFREDGDIIYKALQGGTTNVVAFTSYVAAVVHGELHRYPQYQPNVELAIDYVYNYCDIDDVYSLALATYLLYEANDENKIEFVEELLNKSTITQDHEFWKFQPPSDKTSSLDIEITSYALLVLNRIPELFDDAFKALQWLIAQPNLEGGLESTQDFVVGMEAIFNFGAKISIANNDLNIELKPEKGKRIELKLNSTTSLSTQRYHLDNKVRSIEASGSGIGFAVVELSCGYYLNETIDNPSFELSVTFGEESCDNKIILEICSSFITLDSTEASNLAVYKIEFPSGFNYDSDSPLSPEVQVISL